MLLRSQWHYGAMGGKVRYDYLPLIELAKANDFSGAEIVEIVGQVQVIESATLTCEAEAAEFERERREMEEGAAQSLGKRHTPQQRSPRHRR